MDLKVILLIGVLLSVALGTPHHRERRDDEEEEEGDEPAEQQNIKDPSLKDLKEGDVKKRTDKGNSKSTFRNAYKFGHWERKWPGGVVIYKFESTFSATGMKNIKAAMKHLTTKTNKCITFKERTTERDYIGFTNKLKGCWGYIGMQFDWGKADLSLQEPGCTNKMGTIVHEIMHGLGFWHEHTRSDRDKYITVNMANVIAGQEENFKKQDTDNLVPFDDDSVMAYGPSFFTKNGKPTIVAKNKSAKLGQREGLSKLDIEEIKLMYGCK